MIYGVGVQSGRGETLGFLDVTYLVNDMEESDKQSYISQFSTVLSRLNNPPLIRTICDILESQIEQFQDREELLAETIARGAGIVKYEKVPEEGDHDGRVYWRKLARAAFAHSLPWYVESLTTMDEKNDTVDRLMHAIDRDRYVVAFCLYEINKAIGSREWLLEGRGPYEWDDDKYRLEFGDALKDIKTALEPLSIVAWDKSDCTRIEERVNAAKLAARKLLEKKPGPREMIAADIFGDPKDEEIRVLREAIKPFVDLADRFEKAIERDPRYTLEKLGSSYRLSNFEPTWGQVKAARDAYNYKPKITFSGLV